MLDQSPPSSLLHYSTAPLHSTGQPPLTLHYVLLLNFSTSSDLQGPDSPSHTNNTDGHGHPSGGTSERSVDSLNPHTSSVRGPVGIQGNSVRDDGPIDGCLVLLVVQDCSRGDSDCGLRGGTTKSARDPSNDKKGGGTYTVLLAVQVASIQFPSPGSYQSMESAHRSRILDKKQLTSGGPHGWAVSLLGLTDLTTLTVHQYSSIASCK